MKEYTIIYTAEITEVSRPSELRHDVDAGKIAEWIKSELKADDVHVKNVKIFEREL